MHKPRKFRYQVAKYHTLRTKTITILQSFPGQPRWVSTRKDQTP